MISTTSRIKIPKWLRIIVALAFWLGLWQLTAVWVGKELLLPAPITVSGTLARLCVTADFWAAAGLSVLRIFCGFCLGVLLGAVLAVLSCLSELCGLIFAPAMRLARTTPVASFIILLLLWTGRSMVPLLVSMLMVAPIVWKSIMTAVETTDKSLLEMAGSYRFGRLKTVRLIYLPNVRPAFTAACVTGLGFAWKSGVAAEVLCLPKFSIGTSLYYSKIYLETPELFAWTFTVIALSWLLELLIVRMTESKGVRRR